MTRTRHIRFIRTAAIRTAALMPLAVGVAALLACSDRPTAPPSESSLALSAASVDRRGSDRFSGAAATLAWQKTARNLVASHPISPIAAVRGYALHSVAQYAAVVAVNRGGDDEGGDRGGGRASYEARRGAIAGASAQVLSFLFSDAADALEEQLAADGKGTSEQTHPQFTRGVKLGRAAGEAMITWARNDGFSKPWDESMRNAPGVGIWEGAPAVGSGARPVPAGFQVPTMTPYFLKAMNGYAAQRQFRPAPPPAYSLDAASRFQIDLAEVRNISLHRTQQQIDIANFWNLAAGTPTALGYWGEQAALFIAERHLDERAASHLFALMNAAVMDATIGCWEAKFFYLMLRPTMAEPKEPRITTVYALPNHPSYPSGHSCVSAAAVTILSRYFPAHAEELGTDLIEAGMSRIYGGIHFRFDIEAGQTLGRSTAKWAVAYDRRYGLLRAVGLGGREEAERD
jgi:membrane-associated phospholipid phosphatase